MTRAGVILGNNMLGQLCFVFGAYLFVNAEELVIESNDQCGKSFRLDVVESVTVRYKGGLSDDYRCEIGFTIETVADHLICVQPTSVKLDCGTEIQYHKFFVSDYTNDGVVTCSSNQSSSFSEMCPEYVDKFYIAIMKESAQGTSGDEATIRVFTKDVHTISALAISLAIVGSVIGLVLIISVCVFCLQRGKRRQTRNAQVTYANALGATTIQSGGGAQYPSNTYTQGPDNVRKTFPANTVHQSTDGYQVHPTVTAKPAQNPMTTLGSSYNYQYVPQAQGPGMQATPVPYQSVPQAQGPGMQATPVPYQSVPQAQAPGMQAPPSVAPPAPT